MGERMKKHLVVMMGIPASGKSSIVKEIIAENPNVLVVSRDAIRFSMLEDGDDYFKYEDEVIDTFYRMIQDGLLDAEHDTIIADATHVTTKSRFDLWNHIDIPEGTEVSGYWVDCSVEKAIVRNQGREGRACVPDNVIRNMYKAAKEPLRTEPFHYINYINNYGEVPFITHTSWRKEIL